MRDTPVLVLDEPTAALDAATEHQVMRNLAEWGAGRAIFLITHRISTIRRADNILYLDQGRIVESGDHEALMRRPNGRYGRSWRRVHGHGPQGRLTGSGRLPGNPRRWLKTR